MFSIKLKMLVCFALSPMLSAISQDKHESKKVQGDSSTSV